MSPGRNISARSMENKGKVREEKTGRKGHVLVAVMRFLSHFLAKTDRRSRTYKRRY